MSASYPHLLSSLRVGPVELRNRVVMGSMHTGLEDRFYDTPKLAAYFAERARGGVALAITGGLAVNRRAWLAPMSGTMSNAFDARLHRTVTRAVHDEGGKIAAQLLHAGRYSYHPMSVSASAVKSPINPFRPAEMSTSLIEETVEDFANAAARAREAGYDGVEIMGSEGYLLNQFLCRRVNRRTDEYGGEIENRVRFPVEVVRAVRAAAGADFLVIYRLSLLDLVPGGNTFDEVATAARALEAAGAHMINTGIGWHEARVPTIATSVPRGAFREVTARLRAAVGIPVCASNRINTPELAESILANGEADLVSMARPLLADPDFVRKAQAGTPERINTCIACNQACLDHAFSLKRSSCLVNPRACYETELVYRPVVAKKRVAVVGAGMAGLSAATVAKERGHDVTLFEADARIGGQFRMAAVVPGKEEFVETLRYFDHRVRELDVTLRLGTRVTATDLAGFDEVVVATGVVPRVPRFPGVDHPKVLTYAQVLRARVPVGRKVAIIGAGGIGVDVAEFLLHEHGRGVEDFHADWGIDPTGTAEGGLVEPRRFVASRQIYLLQRKPASRKMGNGPGKTTGWVHKIELERAGVVMMGGLEYEKVDDAGLHVREGDTRLVLEVDHVILCAGQESVRDLVTLDEDGRPRDARFHLIGGAKFAGELDAKRAVREGAELAARL